MDNKINKGEIVDAERERERDIRKCTESIAMEMRTVQGNKGLLKEEDERWIQTYVELKEWSERIYCKVREIRDPKCTVCQVIKKNSNAFNQQWNTWKGNDKYPPLVRKHCENVQPVHYGQVVSSLCTKIRCIQF